MRRAGGQTGQVIAIYAVAFLLIALVTALTIGVGVRVREKIKVQSASDAAAYGLAVTEARTMNTMAWANRSIVARYVSMLSVVGHESYLNFWEGTLKAQSKALYGPIGEYGLQCIGCPFGCSCCCQACKSAKKANDIRKMWNDQWDKVHKRWHVNGRALHTALTALDNAWVGAAGLDYLVGVKAYNQVRTFSQNQTFAKANGQAIDKRMDKAGAGGATWSNFSDVVSIWPAKEDWDSYQEILTGTRTDWILNHNKFVDGIPWIEGLGKEAQIAAGCSGFATSYNDTPSGGGMMMQKDKDYILTVNHGKTHGYHDGSDFGEGGRLGAGAEDHGGTNVFMVCMACEPVTYGRASLGAGQDYMYQEPMLGGCVKRSYHKAYDGFDDGDTNSGAGNSWGFPTNGITNKSGCGGLINPGIDVGFFRFAVDNDTNIGKSAAQDILWAQPYTYASLALDVTQDGRKPWDFDFGYLGGSLLTVKGDKDPTGGASQSSTRDRDTASSLDNKGYNNLVYPHVRGFGTGLAYYHNPTAWKEVPNLWNPFWRAKLEDPTSFQKNAGKGASDDLKKISTDDQKVGQAMGY